MSDDPVSLRAAGAPGGLRASPVRSYGAAVGLVVVATLARGAMTPWVGDDLPFLTYFPAVFVAAAWLGLGPTLLAVALAAVVADYLYIAPASRFVFADPAALIALGTFGAVGVAVAYLGQRADDARRGAEAEAEMNLHLREVAEEAAALAEEEAARAEEEAARAEEEAARAETEAERAVRAASDAARLAGERERLGAALEAERARLAAVLRQMPAGVLLRDGEGRLLEINAEAARLLGGTAPDRIEPDDGAHAPLRHLDGRPFRFDELPVTRATRHGETVRDVEMLIDRRDGTTVRVSVNAAPVRDGADGVVAVVVTFLDLTAHRETEAALRESRDQLEFALEAGHMGTFDWLIPEERVLWSPTLERMHGYAPGTFAGTAEAYFAEVHPDDRERVGALVAEVFAGRREHHMEYRIVRPDGSALWVEGRGRLVRDEAGQPLRLVGVCLDINDRRLAEEAARRSQRLEAMGQLAAGIAHDTNNMMAAVLGYVHLLHRAADLPRRLQRELQEIIKAAERTSNLTQQLLAFSRRQLVTPEVLDLNAAIAEMQDMLRRMLGPRVALDLRLSDAECWVSFDRTQLVQVLLNLALNARDAMPGGGRLGLRTCRLPEDATVDADGVARRIALEIRDTGTGMEEGTRLRAFEPFFTTKEPGKGTGLGLSTVHGIVTQAGGTIAIDSAPGAGTTFRIALPCAAPPGPAAAAEPAAAPATRGRVLLVDDEEMVRALAARMLEEEGCIVEAVESGEAALARLRDGAPFDVLVTDLTMPGMSGRELAARVMDAWPELPVLFITGHHGAALDALDGTRAALLQKPFSPEALAGALGRLLPRGART